MLKRNGRLKDSYTYQPPFGASIDAEGVHFSVFSRSASAMRILLYSTTQDREPTDKIELSAQSDKIGDIWTKFVPGLKAGQLYHFQADGLYRPESGWWFDNKARLIDPYCQALSGDFQPSTDGVIRPPKCVVVDQAFDWKGDRPLRHPIEDSIIYEMHVAGFTKHPSSGVSKPGTYLGAIEKIPYLQSLGITAVELLPVHEFPILDFHGQPWKHPNYWGYDPLALLAPHRGYADSKEPGAQVHEFKTLVKELHRAGIEVILDVVFNHTCEGNQRGPILSMKGLENPVYYILNSEGANYSNFSGCGNTINCNHPICREWIMHSLRHWVHNYHVDGFRFDLASILARDRSGNLQANAPVIELIAEDPMLSETKLIAEAWDAAGAYQVGSFGGKRWSEWNGRYRDDIRRFWRGDPIGLGPFATRLCGSSDLYEAHGRAPCSSINFVTSHDGFTLNDLVSYESKHNEANGENNRDGDNNNFSENHGVEGLPATKSIERKRAKQIRNLMATLLLSQGVPMLLMGDEIRRTQQGNNNAYCQDNSISWMNWQFEPPGEDLLRFTQSLISFRRQHPALCRTRFFTGKPIDARGVPDVSWFDHRGASVDWQKSDSGLICWLAAPQANPIEGTSKPSSLLGDILILVNPTQTTLTFAIPKPALGIRWQLFIDTSKQSPQDIFPEVLGVDQTCNEPTRKLSNPANLRVLRRSMMVWIQKR